MLDNFELKLRQAGFTKLSPIRACAILLAILMSCGYVLAELTGSLQIASSICVCLLFQCLDLFNNRILGNLAKQNLEWPKYLEAINSATWSGTSLQQAILDCRNFAPSLSLWAFDELEKDLANGIDFQLALQNLKSRLANPIADRFVELARLAIDSGGKGFLLALRTQSNQLRLENATWQEIHSKQSWVIATARLAVFAPWLVLLLLSLRKDTASAFASDTGLLVLSIGLAASLVAFQLVRILARLPKRQRILVGS